MPKLGQKTAEQVKEEAMLSLFDALPAEDDPSSKEDLILEFKKLIANMELLGVSAKDFPEDLLNKSKAIVYGESPQKKPSSPPSGLAIAVSKAKDGRLPDTGAPHMIVLARAGTGKTTTLVQGLKALRGLPLDIEPSPQQAAIWAEMSKGKVDSKFLGFVAFNKSIAKELQRRLPADCDSSTLHSLGFKAVRRAFPLVECDEDRKPRLHSILEEITGVNIRDLRRTKPGLVEPVLDLTSLVKKTLTQTFGRPEREVFQDLQRLADHYNVEIDRNRAEVFALVPRMIERCKLVEKDNKVDYDDMVWLPVVLRLPVFRYSILLVDEAQDLNRAQQELAKMAGRRLILCGDDRQAIYGFAGADSDSLPRLARELKQTTRQCVTLPLTVTRRCGKAVVEEARRYVPDFEAYPTNPSGVINHARYPIDPDGREIEYSKTYLPLVRDGDMVLCRVNAPLVSQCFRFLKEGRKATIQGRDMIQGLVSTIKKQKAATVSSLIVSLGSWFDAETKKELGKESPSENRLILLRDRYDCLMTFTDGLAPESSPDLVVEKIEKVFTDDPNVEGIKLSSIHKAKGLEARRVFFLRPKGGECPHPMAKSPWQRQQEENLCYVAITRAIEELTYVS